MYNDKVIINKGELITPTHNSMIPVDCFQKKDNVINFTNDNMRSNFEAFSKNKMDSLYLTESIQTEWLKMLY